MANQACKRRGDGPQLCSIDRSLHFQLRQHRIINCRSRLLLFVVVELHHSPTTSTSLSWLSVQRTINSYVHSSVPLPQGVRHPSLFPRLAARPFISHNWDTTSPSSSSSHHLLPVISILLLIFLLLLMMLFSFRTISRHLACCFFPPSIPCNGTICVFSVPSS